MPSTLYTGKPGSGKSTLLRTHVTELVQTPNAPVVLIVNHGEKAGEPSWRDVPGARVYRSVQEWWHDPSHVAVFEGVPGVEVAALAIAVGWSIYVDDECDDIVRDGRWTDNPLREIIKRGRHLANRAGEVTEVHAWLATQRVAGLPGDLQGLFDRVYVGRLDGWNDADRVRAEGWVTGRTVEDVLARLRVLAPDSPYEPGPRSFLWYP